MLKVLHYKSNFLNYSETFIKRLIDHHKQVESVGMCVNKRDLAVDCPVYQASKNGFDGLRNTLCFHLNLMLPFYWETIKSTQPDIIHAHFGFDGYRMIKPSKKSGIPLIVSFYGSDVTRLPSEFDWKRRYRKLADHADRFIAISNLMKEQLIQLGFPEEKITVVRFGLDLNTFSYNTSYHANRPLMMAGRMVAKKGFIDAIEGIKILRGEGKDVHLDLYGDGKLRSQLENNVSQWNLDHLIHFKGRQPITTIRSAYRNHSGLLVPSVTAKDDDQEGIPNTLLEGMASGIPVITTDHSAIPEAITHRKNGFIIPENDARALANMIKKLKRGTTDTQTMRRNARKKILTEYGLHRMVKMVETVYKKAMM